MPDLYPVEKCDRELAADIAEHLPTEFQGNDVAAIRLGIWDDGKLGPIVQIAAKHRIDNTLPAGDVAGLVAPWKDYHGDLPDYDHPLRCVFESGIQYAVELLAKELKVEDYDICDGTEEFDGDLGGTLMNIVLAALPENADGDPMWPEEIASALSISRARDGDGVIEAVARALYEQERLRSVRAWEVLHGASGKPCNGILMEPWEECRETFLSDARAALRALKHG